MARQLITRISFAVLSYIIPITLSFAGGPDIAAPPDIAPSTTQVRASVGFGPRYINDQVMTADKWDTTLRMSLGTLWNYQPSHCYYGFDLAGNSSWSARYNSVGVEGEVFVAPVTVHNSSSIDFLGIFGYKMRLYGFELGAGGQLSWVKWVGATEQAISQTRVLPKVRLAVTRAIAKNAEVFLALSQVFNVYGKLTCPGNFFNCFNENGFVYVTDLTTGVNFYFR